MIGYRVANILLHVVFISTFLTVFFFTYASKIESKIVESQSKRIISELTGDVKLLLPDNVIGEINSRVATVEPPNMQEEDDKVLEANKKLKTKVASFVGVVFFIGLVIVWLMCYFINDPKFTFFDLVKHNAIILCFVALTEYVFLDYFARNYISIDSNFVKYTILETINQKL